MNEHILFVMRSLDNPELFTQEEKEANNRNAHAAADAAYAAAYAAYAADAAYAAADAHTAAYAAAYTAADAHTAADAAYTAAYAADADAAAYAADATYAVDDKVISKIDHWLSRYFQTTGEDRQEYINEVERLRE